MIGASPSYDTMTNLPAGYLPGLGTQGMPALNTFGGRVFWLDSQNGSDTNRGTFARPFATLMGAQRAMLSPAPVVYGDILFVKQGHRETISNNVPVLSLSGLQIIGLGTGDDRPTFIFDTTILSTITVCSMGITIQNCRFVANFLNVNRPITISAGSCTGTINGTTLTATSVVGVGLRPGATLASTTAGFVPGTKIIQQLTGAPNVDGTYLVSKPQTVASGTITAPGKNFCMRGCDVSDTSAVLNFAGVANSSSLNNVCDGASFVGNTVTSLSTTVAVSFFVPNGNTDRLVIANNIFRSKTPNGAALIPINATRVITNATIVDNVFDTVGLAGTTTGILVTTDQTTNTGVVARNTIQNLDATTPILATAGSGLVFFENYYASAQDKTGVLLPTV